LHLPRTSFVSAKVGTNIVDKRDMSYRGNYILHILVFCSVRQQRRGQKFVKNAVLRDVTPCGSSKVTSQKKAFFIVTDSNPSNLKFVELNSSNHGHNTMLTSKKVCCGIAIPF
jgi:hypothetical protein